MHLDGIYMYRCTLIEPSLVPTLKPQEMYSVILLHVIGCASANIRHHASIYILPSVQTVYTWYGVFFT